MDCLRCKEEMIKAKLKGDAVGTVVYLTNKKNGIFENEKLEGRTAWIHLETDDPYLSGMHKVRYRMVGVTSMNNPPRENEYLRGLILGIGYNGFSAYKDNGQERR